MNNDLVFNIIIKGCVYNKEKSTLDITYEKPNGEIINTSVPIGNIISFEDTVRNKYLCKNHFLLRFPEGFELNSWNVVSVYKEAIGISGSDKSSFLVVKIKNCYYTDIEIKEICEKFNERQYPYIIFEDLHSDGTSAGNEYYLKPKVESIYFEPSDYRKSEFKECQLRITYEDVTTKID